MKLKDMPKATWPREKLMERGPENLSDTELIAIILRTGRAGMDVMELSRHLLKKHSLDSLMSLKYSDLVSIKGLDSSKACSLLASIEMARRVFREKKSDLPIIEAFSDILPFISDMQNYRKEHFVVLYLNARNQFIDKETISIGTLNSVIVHPREVFEPALRHFSASVILVHNHPSGSFKPSPEDEVVTRQIAEAGKIMGINLMDHVIVSKNGYFSFRESGFLSDFF